MKRFSKTALAIGMMAIACHSYAVTTTPSAANNTNTANTTQVNVSPEEKAKIEQVVHDYLIAKPEVLIEAMQALQKKQFEQAEQTVKQTQLSAGSFINPLFHQATDPVAGNPNGKITVTEFFDYQCPHCVDMAPVMDAIIKANPNVRIVFKDFPIRGPMSEFTARAAIAANKQGKYYEFSHALLLANKQLTQDVVYQIAKNTGLDVDKLKKDMNDASVNNQIKANMKLAQDLKLFGTPAFFIGKTDAKSTDNINYIPGQANQKQLQTLIDKVGN